jgi:hypothetical protein
MSWSAKILNEPLGIQPEDQQSDVTTQSPLLIFRYDVPDSFFDDGVFHVPALTNVTDICWVAP